MRTVEKGTAPKSYSDYSDARHDLAMRIGYYCSYCEMSVSNMIEVEHIVPINRGGNPLNWDNFLLSCRYCNGVKSDNNFNRIGYVWADRDNTDLVFKYSEIDVIEPQTIGTSIQIQAMAENTIRLMGLDRIPGGIREPSEADTRWRSREEAWTKAKNSLIRWQEASIPAMAKQIAITSLSAHYSIWKEVFSEEQEVLDAIDFEYASKGLFNQFRLDGRREIRPLGNI